MPPTTRSDEFTICGVRVPPGSRRYLDLPLPKAFGHAELRMPVVVCHGRRPGPAILVSAAVHGDEVIGTEIIRRLLDAIQRRGLRGTVVAVPVVNAYGFIAQQRYLPDRRDLNRSFPGSSDGSLAGRLARLFLDEIVARCDYAVDLHSGAIHRDNLPQIRADLGDPRVRELADAFGVPVLLDSDARDGSLREAVCAAGKPMLLFEGGEALRFDEHCIRAGLHGCLNVLAQLRILPRARRRRIEPAVARTSRWVRATASGLLRPHVRLGAEVAAGQVLASISDPTGRTTTELTADDAGIIIGRLNLPLVNAGDAVCHLGYFRRGVDPEEVAGRIEDYDADMRERDLDEEQPIV